MKMYYIYKITNKTNNKSYIGFTSNLKERFKVHRSKQTNLIISRAIRKYGVDNFTFDILYQSFDKDYALNVMEQKYIEEYDTINQGYNQRKGGFALIGSDNYMYGKTHSEETKHKISIKAKGRVSPRKGATLSDESKQKISAKNKGKQPRQGAILSDTTKNKIRQSLLGKKLSEETKRKISESLKRRRNS